MNATNEVKHTPGPWDWDKGTEPHFQSVVYGEGNGRNIAVCYHDESNANARLIAAAPELLYALEDLIQRCELPNGGLDQSPTHEGLTNCNVLAKARAVIAKATQNPN